MHLQIAHNGHVKAQLIFSMISKFAATTHIYVKVGELGYTSPKSATRYATTSTLIQN